MNNLRTLDALVYEVQLSVELDTFEKMSTMEQMNCLLSTSSDLLHDIRSLLVPFLYRMEDLKPGDFYNVLYAFCIDQAKTDLTIPMTIVENSGPRLHGSILQDPKEIIKLGIDSCYANETGSQMDLIDRISRAIVDYFEVAPGRWRSEFIQEHRLNVDEFTYFLQHLEIGRILCKNGVSKSLSVFKTNGADRAAMQKIFESITCHAESRKPRLEQDGWRTVLRDLQRLQKLVPVVPIHRVFYMFCESLLSSGSAANIDLAGDVLKTMVEPEEQIQLVLTAWTHYYTTSANLYDPNIELAKHCLCLVKSSSKELLECSDLISALQSLADFGLPDIHPISVLKSKNRLDFVIKALDTKPHAYKNSQRLMKLSTLLKAESIENLEGLVWSLVAKKALEVGDYTACHTACNNIIQCGYTKGWDVCFALGVTAEFPDLQKCLDLLSFSVSHCDQDNIEHVILSLLKVEQKLLHSTITAKADLNAEDEFIDVDEDEEEEKFEDSFEEVKQRSVSPFPSVPSVLSSLNVKNTLLNVTGLSTQYLVDNEISRTVLDHTAAWIHNIVAKENQDSFIDEDVGKNFDSLRFPAFYSSLFNKDDVVLESLADPNFRKFFVPRVESNLAQVTQQVLRSQLLSGVLLDLFAGSEPVERTVSKELLKELVPLVATQDMFQVLFLFNLILRKPSTYFF